MRDYEFCSECSHPVSDHKDENGYSKPCQCGCTKLLIYVSEQERKRLIDIRSKFYSLKTIQWAIVNQINLNSEAKIKRELCILSKAHFRPKDVLRYINAYRIDYLMTNLNGIDFINNPFANLYYSLSHLSYVPPTTLNLRERTREESYQKFNEEYEKYMVGYDLLFDFDTNRQEGIDTIQKVYGQAKEFKEFLDERKVAYSLRFSGTKGFHIMIPFDYMDWGVKDIPNFVNRLGYLVKNIHWGKMLYSIDLSVTDFKQVAKIPYTLDRDNVCLPLTDEQFEHFPSALHRTSAKYVLEQIQLFNRGDLVRTHELPKETLIKNFKRLFDDYAIEG